MKERILSAASSGQLEILQFLLEAQPHAVLRTADLTLEEVCGTAVRTRQHEIVSSCVTSDVDLDDWDVLKGDWTANRLTYAKSSYQQGSTCLLYTSPSPRDATLSRMPSSA